MKTEATHLRKVLTTARNQLNHVRDQINDDYESKTVAPAILRILRSAIGKGIYAFICIRERQSESDETRIRWAQAKAEILAGADPSEYGMMMIELMRFADHRRTEEEQEWIDYLESIE